VGCSGEHSPQLNLMPHPLGWCSEISFPNSVLAEPKFNRIVNCQWVLDILSVAIRTEVKFLSAIG
jgi:hypothetical protein